MRDSTRSSCVPLAADLENAGSSRVQAQNQWELYEILKLGLAAGRKHLLNKLQAALGKRSIIRLPLLVIQSIFVCKVEWLLLIYANIIFAELVCKFTVDY